MTGAIFLIGCFWGIELLKRRSLEKKLATPIVACLQFLLSLFLWGWSVYILWLWVYFISVLVGASTRGCCISSKGKKALDSMNEK